MPKTIKQRETATQLEPLVGPDLVLDFLHRLGTCHNCQCLLITDFGCRHCEDGCPSSCEDCEVEHDDLTTGEYEAAIDAARRQLDVVANLAKLVQRLSRKCTDEKLKLQATGYLERMGLNSHSILR